MEYTKKQNAIFYIDLGKGFFLGSNVQTILQVDFPPDTFADGGIINKEKFLQLLQVFIQTNKIEPCPLILVFSKNISFEKEFKDDSASEKNDAEIAEFIELVPFEEVLSTTYKLNNKKWIVAFNRELLENVNYGFEKEKFTVVSAVPYSVLEVMIAELANNLDLNILLSKFEVIKQYDLTEEIEPLRENKSKTEAKTKNNNRVYVLLGIFGILAVVLVVLFITTVLAPTKPKRPALVKYPPSGTPPVQTTSEPFVTPKSSSPGALLIKPLQTTTATDSSIPKSSR